MDNRSDVDSNCDLSDVPIYMPQKSILAIYELQFFLFLVD